MHTYIINERYRLWENNFKNIHFFQYRIYQYFNVVCYSKLFTYAYIKRTCDFLNNN